MSHEFENCANQERSPFDVLQPAMTYKQIAELEGVHETRIRQIIRRAHKKMRRFCIQNQDFNREFALEINAKPLTDEALKWKR